MSTVDDGQQRLRWRLLIKWVLVVATIGGILGVLIQPPDAFPSPEFVGRVHSDWVGGVAALFTFALGMLLWVSKAFRLPNSKSPLVSQAITGSLVVCALNGFTYCFATSNVERWVARYNAVVDIRYLTTVEPSYQKGCPNSVEWYDPTVKGDVNFCTNLAIFGRRDSRQSREAIAHVLRGPSGIRVVTIRALDTELGQEDLAAMRSAAHAAGNQSSVPQ